jgi:prepilin-type N-terminal cleavage/methylation domain-containing protein
LNLTLFIEVKPNRKVITPLKTKSGFTLIEAMLSVALLALVAVGISAPYISGFQALDVQADRMPLDSSLRSRMDILAGTNFGSLNSGSESVTVNGENYTIAWTVGNIDLDGDATPESTAKQVTVSITELPQRSLTAILVDNDDRIGKIP